MNGSMELGKPPRRAVAVSVVVLTYRDHAGLSQTIESVIRQEHPVLQLIVSDDGSPEPIPELVATELRRAFPEPGRLLIRRNHENMGTVAHMNQTAALCQGDYIKFLSAGDAFSSPGALADLVDFAREQRALAVTSNAVVCNGDLHRRYYVFPGCRRGALLDGPNLFQTLCRGNLVSAAGTLLHRRFFTEFGGFDEAYRLLEDWPAWLRLAREGRRIPFLPKTTCCYAAGGVSSWNLDAFGAQRLRADMMRCYEREILPYSAMLDDAAMAEVRYGYGRLKGAGSWELFRKYPAQVCKSMIKRGVKWSLFKLCAGRGRPV